MVRVYTSSVIAAPLERVWALTRDFNALPLWHPAIAVSRIEEGRSSDQVGCIRNFTLQDGGVIREQLLMLSDMTHQCTYSILESPMGVDNYVATLAFTRVTDGNRCFAEWTADFNCAPEKVEELTEQIGQGVFQTGFDAINLRFS